jgi:hypothetical protein
MVNSSTGGLGRAVSLDNGTEDGTERVMAFYSANTLNLIGQYRPAGSTIFSETGENGVASVIQRSAIAFAAADGAVYQNGTRNTATAGTPSSVTVPLSVTKMRIGNITATNRPFIGWVRRVRVFNVRKSNTDLATLTTVA